MRIIAIKDIFGLVKASAKLNNYDPGNDGVIAHLTSSRDGEN